MFRQAGALRCADISSKDRKISIYNLKRKQLLFKDADANSVSIQFALATPGIIVRFAGATAYTLQATSNSIGGVSARFRYIEAQAWDSAFKIACLGVTKFEWERLDMAARWRRPTT